jgi:hypothetical protein
VRRRRGGIHGGLLLGQPLRGGIDSDHDNLHDGATPYVAEALDDVLARREPRVTEAKALGCTLQKW